MPNAKYVKKYNLVLPNFSISDEEEVDETHNQDWRQEGAEYDTKDTSPGGEGDEVPCLVHGDSRYPRQLVCNQMFPFLA